MNNLLLSLAGALILALGALFVGPYFVDWNSYRAVFEAQATRLAGRPVSVQGNVNLRLLPAPYVSFEKVEIAGDAAGVTPPLLKVKNYTLWLSVPPLLQGEFEARAMEIDQPSLRLALGEDGNLNWSGLGEGDVDLPFVPRNVAFKDTNIQNGSIEIVGANGATLTTLTDITGTFTARRLTGPFKFIGETAGQSVRWSTGRVDENGGLRIKGTVKGIDAGTTYAADGLLQNMTTRPVFTGGIAGKLRKKGSAGFEMKTDVYADTSGAQFKDITLLLDAEGRPQIVNGTGRAVWEEGSSSSATIELASRWLDVDRLIARDGEKKGMHSRLDTVQAFLADALPRTIATTARFKATQVNFGGEALDDLDVTIAQKEGITEVTSLSASAPGAAAITLTGQISQPNQTTPGAGNEFKGKITVRGRTASRFVNWLNPDWTSWVKQGDGTFAMKAAIAAGSDSLRLDNIDARLGETRVSGRLERGAADTAPLKIELATDDLDVTRYVADVAEAGQAIRTWLDVKGDNPEAADNPSRQTDVKLAIGNLTVGTSVFADVSLDASVVAKQARIRRAAFASASGLEVDAERRDTDQNDVQSTNAPLRYVLRVRNAAAYEELLALAGISGLDGAIDITARSLLPAHLAGRVSQDDAENAVNVRYDGTVAGNPSVGRIRIDGEAPEWRDRTWTVTTDVALTNPQKLLSHYGIAQAIRADDVSAPAPGRIVLYAIGRPKKGLKTDFELQSEDLTLGFAGAVSSAGENINLAGDLTGKAAGQKWFSQLMGQGQATITDVTFSSEIARSSDATRLTDIRIATGEGALTGTATITAQDGRDTITVEANAVAMSLTALLGRLSQAHEENSPPSDAVWPETPFDFSRVSNKTVNATIAVDRLHLAKDITTRNATFRLHGGDGRIELADLNARVGEGTLTANASLERRPAGAELKLNVQGAAIPLLALSGAEAEQSDDTPVTANGLASFEMSLGGVGLSPKGVISVMKGEGKVSLENATLTYFSPQVVQDVAADIAEENIATNPTDIKARLLERLADRALDIGTQTVAFRIRDGALQADKVRLATPAAAITATTFVDIARLRLDSEWRIAPKAAGGSAPLPPVTVFYAGDVRNVSQLQPGFGVAALERELTVRRLEGNIDQLEGLQSLRLKKKETDPNASSRGRLRPTIGGEPERRRVRITPSSSGEIVQPVPPKAPIRKRRLPKASREPSTGDGLWDLNAAQPPVELELQTPEGANPT